MGNQFNLLPLLGTLCLFLRPSPVPAFGAISNTVPLLSKSPTSSNVITISLNCVQAERGENARTTSPSAIPKGNADMDNHDSLTLFTRRDVTEKMISVAAAYSSIALGTMTAPLPAGASGGATAGGAYLLSAKQRYNERVTTGIKAFLSLNSSLESGDFSAVKSFFESEEAGGWKDTSTAGYLLSNAFRRSSNTPPDSLPSVKKWKTFQADVAALEKAVKKKQGSEARNSYRKAEESLDAYLEAVELPPVVEMRQ